MSKISNNLASIVLGGIAFTGLAGCATNKNTPQAPVRSTTVAPKVESKVVPNRETFVKVEVGGYNREEVIYSGKVNGTEFTYHEFARLPAYGNPGEDVRLGNFLRVIKPEGSVTFEDGNNYHSIGGNDDYSADKLSTLTMSDSKTDLSTIIGRDGDRAYANSDMPTEASTVIMVEADREYNSFRMAIKKAMDAKKDAQVAKTRALIKIN